MQKPQVKLRRAVSEVARPASTPPIMASAIKDEDDEDRIIAELEVGRGSAAPEQAGPRPILSVPHFSSTAKGGSRVPPWRI